MVDRKIPGRSSDADILILGENLHKSFVNGNTRIDILTGTDFSFKQGETVAIVGPSGIGKSTFLHILGTLDRPDQGSIRFQNKAVFDFSEPQLAEFRNATIGFVFQFHHLLPEFTSLENVMMPAHIRGVLKNAAKEAAESFLVRVGLKERLNHRVNELSGGEQQRVALARALVNKPLLLLADEPTGNLDNKNSDQVHELFIELNQEFDMTLIVVTHNLELAAHMSRRISIVDGQLTDI